MSAKFKIFSPSAQLYKLVFFLIVPLMGALWVSTTRIVDHHHTTGQVIAGSIIGLLAAITGYTHNFGWGWYTYYNHIPARYAFHDAGSLKPETDAMNARGEGWTSDDTIGMNGVGGVRPAVAPAGAGRDLERGTVS
ncbi:hypothetical protein HK104_006055 [Borealophlyctis nickersoniae]|nr:hypothetical protein HK104_006055 [Borealophlyctis nickersoniae]